MDDDRLIDETLDGRPSSFGQLVVKYQDRLYNALAYATGSPDDARDVAQDAFVQAFVKLSTFERASAFYTWLYRIAMNLAATRRRRSRPSVSIDQLREQAGVDPVDPGDAPDGRMQCRERAGQVHAALARLSEEHREIIVLRDMEGNDYESIAVMIDVPVGTVRSRLHRARLQLREQLQLEFENE
jgi:RNA polymerase sigma-70 factor (ECF subfamily)